MCCILVSKISTNRMKFVNVIKEKVTVWCHTHNISLRKPIDPCRYAKLHLYTKFQLSIGSMVFSINYGQTSKHTNNCVFIIEIED